MNNNILNSPIRNLIAILVILIYLAGCDKTVDGNNSGTDQSQTPTISLTANPTAVSPNGSTSLNWNSTDASSCTASGDWSGNKDTSGSEIISRLQTDSTFNLSCTGDGGSVSTSVNVKVSTQPVTTVSLSANPTSVSLNGATTLSWDSSNADSCTASGDWSGSRSASGEETISSLTENSTYNLSCTGLGGTAEDTVSVTIDATTVTVNLTADPTSISLSGSTTLSWESSNADSCTASGDWSGSKDVSGSETINALTADSQFILSCSDANGSVSDSVDVTITLSGNGTALLSWTPQLRIRMVVF